MKRLSLTMSVEEYDRTRALLDGSVKAERLDLKVFPLPSGERHFRMLREDAFDVCELSMSSYLMAKTRGKSITALPIFPRRLFPHSFIYVNRKKGVEKPRDLVGRRVGIGMYQVTMAMLAKGFLRHEYGVKPEDVTWVTGREELISFNTPRDVRIERAPSDAAAHRMLATGELDAGIYPDVIPPFEEHPDKVQRLFPDFKQRETDYFKKTSIYPIMHVIAVKNQVLDKHPWVAPSLLKAFTKAKHACYEFLKHPPNHSLVWSRHHLEEQRGILGEDPFPYGLKNNEKAVKQLTHYSKEQGLIDYMPTLAELFYNE